MITSDLAVHQRVMKRVLRKTSEWSFDRTPPEMGQEIHRIIRQETGDPDPYLEIKKHSNRFALALLPGLRKRIEDDKDAFATSVRIAIAGNIMDFAISSELSESDVIDTIEETINCHLAKDNIDELRSAVRAAGTILYIADNAGEIALDRLLLEQLPIDKVILSVRGSPVINDATLEDAEAVGITELVSVIDNGTDVPGTILKKCSASFQEHFLRADVVIAKGQGNYETLSAQSREIFFLLRAKCPIIARDIGCQVGDSIAFCSTLDRAGPRA